MIRFETSHGEFLVELFPKEAPVTVENFLRYVDDGHFDGTIFHRIVPGFVIQGGGLTADFASKKTRAPISNEARNGLKNTRGSLSMARTSDINSATSQFFVNLADNAFLDHGPRDYGYAVFGRVTQGMEVIDKIARDRKSTRLNSSHSQISYAVFCLKKKKKKNLLASSFANSLTSIARSFSARSIRDSSIRSNDPTDAMTCTSTPLAVRKLTRITYYLIHL